MNEVIVSRYQEFMDNEARSCSMGFGCVTPEYVYYKWEGILPLNDIEAAMSALRQVQEPVRRMM